MIDILLATYNGEKYIKTQLLSILSQTFLNWRLIIHDDGSNDRTVEIIKEISKIDSRICLIEDGIELKNAALNFLHLLQFSDSEYAMFCDQDDIWFDNKIEYFYNFFTTHAKDTRVPSVAYHNSYVWDPVNGIAGMATLTFPRDLTSLLFLNAGTQGCASLFNAAMRDYLLLWDGECSMHDHILNLIGCSFGKVWYMNVPLMLYRQHGNNVTGGTRVNKNDIHAIKNNLRVPVVNELHYNSVAHFLEVYNEILSTQDKRLIEKYIRMKNMCMIEKIGQVIRTRFKCYDSVMRLIIKIIIKPFIGSFS